MFILRALMQCLWYCIAAKVTNSKIVILLIIAYLTTLIPVLGAAFGAPDLDVGTVVILSILGLAGGGIWSTPFVL